MYKEEAVIVWLSNSEYRDIVKERLVKVLEDEEISFRGIEEIDPRTLIILGVSDGYRAALELRGLPGITLLHHGVVLEAPDTSSLITSVASVIATNLVQGDRFNLVVRGLSDESRLEEYTIKSKVLLRIFEEVDARVDEERPDKLFTLYVISREKLLVSLGHMLGLGGLPDGLNGRALILFNGSLGSSIATTIAARTGYEPVLLFADTSTLSPDGYLRRAFLVAHSLSRVLKANIRELYVIPITRSIVEVLEKINDSSIKLWIYFRLLSEAASKLADKLGLDIIFSGSRLSSQFSIVFDACLEAQIKNRKYFALPLVYYLSDYETIINSLLMDEELIRTVKLSDWHIAEPPFKWGQEARRQVRRLWVEYKLSEEAARLASSPVRLAVNSRDPVGGLRILDEYLAIKEKLRIR